MAHSRPHGHGGRPADRAGGLPLRRQTSRLGLALGALTTFAAVIGVRGFVDVLFRRMIPWPSLFGTDAAELRADDVLARRRAWFWRKWIGRAR